MARVNIDILGISELKWTEVGVFNSDDYYIYYYGQESLRRNAVAIIVQKSPKCSAWIQSQKWQNDLCSFPRHTIQYHSNPSLCPKKWCWRSWSWMVLCGSEVKHLPPMQETQVRSLGWEDRLEKEMVTHSSILAWRIPWMEKPGRVQSMGSQRVGHDWVTKHIRVHLGLLSWLNN